MDQRKQTKDIYNQFLNKIKNHQAIQTAVALIDLYTKLQLMTINQYMKKIQIMHLETKMKDW